MVDTYIRTTKDSSPKDSHHLNCIQNQITTHGKVLIQNKVAGFVEGDRASVERPWSRAIPERCALNEKVRPASRTRAAGTPRTWRAT